MNFYKFYTILEGQAEDYIKQNPDLIPAYDQGIKNINYLKWININKKTEPLNDIIPVLLAFEKNKTRLKLKDINQYKSVAQLRYAIEDLGKSKSQTAQQLKNDETTKIGTFGDWTIVMPHTKESSCQWGKDTTWCTTSQEVDNQFLNYVGEKDSNIILFYLIEKNADPRNDPDSKLSIGFKDGEPVLNGEMGGISVNAANQGLDENKLINILGMQYQPIMNALKRQAAITGKNHPAKIQMQQLASGERSFGKYTINMNRREVDQFLNQLTQYKLEPDGIYEIIKFGSRWFETHDMLSKMIINAQNPFQISKDIILVYEHYFDHWSEQEAKWFKTKQLSNEDISILLRFGSLIDWKSINPIISMKRMETLMKMLGPTEIYKLQHEDIQEIFDLISNKKPHGIKILPNAKNGKSEENNAQTFYDMLQRHAPEWDAQTIGVEFLKSKGVNIESTAKAFTF